MPNHGDEIFETRRRACQLRAEADELDRLASSLVSQANADARRDAQRYAALRWFANRKGVIELIDDAGKFTVVSGGSLDALMDTFSTLDAFRAFCREQADTMEARDT